MMGWPHHQQTALTFLSLSYAFALIALHLEEARFTLIVFIKQIRRSRRKASYSKGTHGLFCSHFHSAIITSIFFSGVSILHLSVAPVQLGLIRLLLLFWFTPLPQLSHLLELTFPFLTGIFPTVIGLVVLTDLTVSFLVFVIVSHVVHLLILCLVGLGFRHPSNHIISPISITI